MIGVLIKGFRNPTSYHPQSSTITKTRCGFGAAAAKRIMAAEKASIGLLVECTRERASERAREREREREERERALSNA
jgi:hypothetical protein